MKFNLSSIVTSLNLTSSTLNTFPVPGSSSDIVVKPFVGSQSKFVGNSSSLAGLLYPNGTATSGLKALNSSGLVTYNGTTLVVGNTTFNINNGTYSNVTEIGQIIKAVKSKVSIDPCNPPPYTPPTPLVLESFATYNPATALLYRYRQQQSVNLGSWFVQEQWMNPTLFQCASGQAISELDVASGYGGVAGAQSALEQHWDTWITESDFAYLASIGINTVRLPIGYWSLGPAFCQGADFEPVASVYTNSWARVVRAINWAAKYDLGVLVDMHGAYGSQNGQPHSGVSTGQDQFFWDPYNRAKTVDALVYLTQQLVDVNNVVGIELLNEPTDDPILADWYTSALATLRAVSDHAAAFPFYVHDAFDLWRFATYVAGREDFVVLDDHSYFVFSANSNSETDASIIGQLGRNVVQDLSNAASQIRRNIIIGEWSCALPAPALEASSNAAVDQQTFCTAQMVTYGTATAGYAFWAYKTESCPDQNWCFSSIVGDSLPSTFYSYPGEEILANLTHGSGSTPSATFSSVSVPTSTSTVVSIPSSSSSTVAFTSSSTMISVAFSSSSTMGFSSSSTTPSTVTETFTQTNVVTTTTTTATSTVSENVSSPAQGFNYTVTLTVECPCAATATIPELSSVPLLFAPTASCGPTTKIISKVGTGGNGAFTLGGAGRGITGLTTPVVAQIVADASPLAGTTNFDNITSELSSPVFDDQDDNSFSNSTSVGMPTTTIKVFSGRDRMFGHKSYAYRRQHNRHSFAHVKRQSVTAITSSDADTQQGYADGHKAAIQFAEFNGSRLGFIGQFILDCLAGSPNILAADTDSYRTAFYSGLADGEAKVLAAIESGSSLPTS